MQNCSKFKASIINNVNLRAYLFRFKNEPKLFISIFGEKITSTILPFVHIYFFAKIINLLTEYSSSNKNKLIFLIIMALGITAILKLCNYLFLRWYNYEISLTKNNKYFIDKFLEMDFASIDSTETHSLYNSIRQNEQWNWWGLQKVLENFPNFCEAILQIIASLSLSVSLFYYKVTVSNLLFLNNPIFIILVLCILILLIFIPTKLITKADSYWAKYSESATEGNRVFSFYFYLFKEKNRAMDVRIYNQQNEGENILTQNKAFTTKGKIASCARKEMGFLYFLSTFISSSLLIVIYIFVSLKALGKAFPIGNLAQYIASITALSGALTSLFTTIGNEKNNSEFLENTFKFLDLKNKIHTGKIKPKLKSENIIEFKSVCFSYPSDEENPKEVLHNINFTLNSNTRLAVVGKNGSGKTTFIKLLCQLYEPTSGEILFNGVNIKDLDYKEYLKMFSVVFQDFSLLSFTMAENITSGKEFKTEADKQKAYEQIREILKLLQFNLNEEKFTKNINTNLFHDFDTAGVKISGGEGQKIAIARALYKNAPFIILDEPTAALDPIAEQEIYEHFNEIVKNKTALYISHRLSSCRFCDEILVFDEGNIVQKGHHTELMQDENGLYKKLFNAQAQYYK